MIVKIKGDSSGHWYLFDADEIEWCYHTKHMKESKAFENAHRIFLNDKDERKFFYQIFLRQNQRGYRQFLVNTEVYILNNEGKTVEVLR